MPTIGRRAGAHGRSGTGGRRPTAVRRTGRLPGCRAPSRLRRSGPRQLCLGVGPGPRGSVPLADTDAHALSRPTGSCGPPCFEVMHPTPTTGKWVDVLHDALLVEGQLHEIVDPAADCDVHRGVRVPRRLARDRPWDAKGGAVAVIGKPPGDLDERALGPALEDQLGLDVEVDRRRGIGELLGHVALLIEATCPPGRGSDEGTL